MNIKDEYVYTPVEVAKFLDVSIRAVQDRCKKYGVSKEGRSYVIPGNILKSWITKNERKLAKQTNETKRSLREHTQEEIIEALEEFSGKQVFLLDDNEQQQFIDISNSQKELTKDLEVRNREFGMLEESKEHYKAQADYFIKANDKLTGMLQKLTDTLKESVDNTRRQQTLNAKDKDII